MRPTTLIPILAAVALTTTHCTPKTLPPAPPPSSPIVTTTAPQTPRPPVVSPVSAAELGSTWRPGCPVDPADLRRVEVDYLGFDGAVHRGALVVHRDLADQVGAIFADLLALRYPIERMRTVEHYPGAEDELSMRDNNTSAFNCRPLPGSTAWSLHAYGRAIDVNPLINPYIDAGGDLQPKTAGEYLDRTRDDPGMLRADSPAVRAFTDRGWRWGGAWHDPIDYQHFET